MDYLIKFFSFVHWLIEILEYLRFIKPVEPDQEPLPMATQTVDVAQQTEDMSETQKPDDREEKLNEEIRYLQEELQEACEENKRKADQLAFDLDTMESQYSQKMAKLAMTISEKITKKDIEILKIKDECDDRIADLELCNASLMQRIVELQTEKVAPSQSLPPSGIPSGQLDPTLDKIANIQEHLSSLDIVTEHSKWTVNYVLEQIKDEITSVTFYRPQPNEEKETLTKDSQSIQFEMEAVKLALADAKKSIAELEKLQSLWIVSESQMKTVADEKESLLASKDAELNKLRESLHQATLKSQLTTRDVGCDTDDLPQLPATERKDVACGTDDFPQFVAAQRRDVGCGTEDLLPLPATNKTEKTSSSGDKQSAREQGQGPKDKNLYSEKLKQPLKGKTEVEAVKQPKPTPETKNEKAKSPTVGESVLETVMEALSPSKFPTAKTPACQPAVDAKSPVTVPPSADVKCNEKPVKGTNATQKPLNGTKPVNSTPRKPINTNKPPAAPENVNVKAAGATAKPADGFVIISKEITKTELKDTLVLSNIPAEHYGRVVGKNGKDSKRIETSHGIVMGLKRVNKAWFQMEIEGGNVENRRAAAQEFIDAVPVKIECPNVYLKKLNTPEFKRQMHKLFVESKPPESPTEIQTINGRLENCRTVYDLLVGALVPPSSPK